MKKNIKFNEVRQRRLKLGLTCENMVELINPLRAKRGAKPISSSTYYKKEVGEIPVFIEEAEDIATVLKRSYKIFLSSNYRDTKGE